MEHGKYEAKTHNSYNNSLIESRYKAFLFLLRMGGIPLNIKSVSKLNTLYKVSIFLCFYITVICGGMDMLVHRHDLSLAMKSFRMLLGMLMTSWLHFSIR